MGISTFFIQKQKVPVGRQVTYVQELCDIRPQKTEVICFRLKAGGYLVKYTGVISNPMEDITTLK